METEDKNYIKGFNNGYILAQHQPELLNKLMGSLDPNNSYCDGLAFGKQEYDREKARNYFKRFERSQPNEKTKEKNKDKGLDMSKG